MKFSEKKKEEKATITTTSTIPTQTPNQSPEKPHINKLCITPQSGWSMISQSSDEDDDEEEVFVDQKKLVKLRTWFDRLHRALLQKSSPYGTSVTAAPALGPDGAAADLFKLFFVVRLKGGRDAVNRRGLWTSVAGELGLGFEFSAAVKLVYAKYLDAFERWVDRGVDVVRELCVMDGGDGEILAAAASRKRKSSGELPEIDGGLGDREDLIRALDWVKGVARNPSDLTVGSLPEPSKWNDEEVGGGEGLVWKKVLMVREALFLKRNNDEHQKNQRMHPGMYTDKAELGYNLRERQNLRRKLFNGKLGGEAGLDSSAANGDTDRSEDYCGLEASIYKHSPSRVRTGQNYQAQVPEFTLDDYQSDPKWLGTKIWPLDKVGPKYSVERDPIGKGRQDSDPCGCLKPGSVDCVRFHIAERRKKMKTELDSAFYLWTFTKMGEEVRLSWTPEEEKRFKDTIASNLSSHNFWDQIRKAFPLKKNSELVSYYYNVYILRRRADQNRLTSSKIDSDDEFVDESETNGDVENGTPESNKSTLLTPNKQHRK